MDKINIAEILKDEPKGIELYSSAVGGCNLFNVGKNDIIVRNFKGDDYTFGKYGVLIDTYGECTLFPSNNMRDWRRFSWKRGDVLSCGNDTFCIFEEWANNDYTKYQSRFDSVTFNTGIYTTLDWFKVTDEDAIKSFISDIEKRKGGKLNLDTLEIEKQPELKDGDIVQVDGDKFIIFKRMDSHRIYYHYFYRNGDICINGWLARVKQTLRLASKDEQLALLSSLANIGKKWNPDTNQIENLPKKCEFKPFDKCIWKIDDGKDSVWQADFVSYTYNDVIVPIGVSKDTDLYDIIVVPYNENTAHLIGTTDIYQTK